MSFDLSRLQFNPWNDYLGVVMQQGRVQLDSDWNEWQAEFVRRIQAGTLDAFGRAAYPATTPQAFLITASTSSSGANQLTIGPGRMYIDGLLAENHGAPGSPLWDSALAELSGSPQPPPAATPAPNALDYLAQPFYPNPPALPGSGSFLAYLDVWIRPVSYLEDARLVDPAVGVDTTGRLQTVWQVKLLDAANVPGITCTTPDADIPGWAELLLPPGATLTSGVVQSAAAGPCCLSPNTGYTGMENQSYRVEIHQPGVPLAAAPGSGPWPAGTATFKWSRDNGSVATAVTAITATTNPATKLSASLLTVQSLGRDNVLGFRPGDWIEITDDHLELNPPADGPASELHQIDSIDAAARTIRLVDAILTAASFPLTSGQTDPVRHTRIRRWDQAGKVYQTDGTNTTLYADLGAAGTTGDIPVPPAGTTLVLESGVTIAFGFDSAGRPLKSGDYWNFAARAADGSVEPLTQAPPRGIHHHYTRLSVVTFPSGATDCRTPWPAPGGAASGCCCTCTVGDGVESVGQYTSIQAAIDALPAKGGEVCILPGRYYEQVVIADRVDVVVHGCGWQTRLASPSYRPDTDADANVAGTSGSSLGKGWVEKFEAIISIFSSRHVDLRSFVIEAGPREAGIYLDGTQSAPVATTPVNTDQLRFSTAQAARHPQHLRVVDTTIADLVITASRRPAILAHSVWLLRIADNRIATQNVPSLWPAVYVSGNELHVERNWVGLETFANSYEWLPASVASDLQAKDEVTRIEAINEVKLSSDAPVKHPGGILVAGPSEDVFILENEIEGGARNGITLGNFEILDANGEFQPGTAGVLLVEEDECSQTVTLQTPDTPPGLKGGGGRVVAGGLLTRVRIDRNRIRHMGLCGIGPIGFFNLLEELEVISITDLTISANTVASTLQRTTDERSANQSIFTYGAICLPDVQTLVIRDNAITDFGRVPGLPVCGIYLLHGQDVEISRNRVLETRDWAMAAAGVESAGARGGILAELVTPPTFSSVSADLASTATGAFQFPVYEPALPALRIENNVVRVPLGQALTAVGFGPFAITNNQFGCGGNVRTEGKPIARTVLIFNLGAALESAGAIKLPSALHDTNASLYNLDSGQIAATAGGSVLFTNNICQLEARADGQHAFASVAIFSADHLIFSNNHCWLDASSKSGALALDAWLVAGSLHVTGNRFQEAPGAVSLSGLTTGVLNITSQNISTYCLLAFGAGNMLVNTDNLVILLGINQNKERCESFQKVFASS